MLHQPLYFVEKIFGSEFNPDLMSILDDSYDSDTLDELSVVFMDDHSAVELNTEYDSRCYEAEAKCNDATAEGLWEILTQDLPTPEKIASRETSALSEHSQQKCTDAAVTSVDCLIAPVPKPKQASSSDEVAKAVPTDKLGSGVQSQMKLHPTSSAKRKREVEDPDSDERSSKVCKMHRWTHEDVMQLIWFWCEASLEPTIHKGGMRVKKWKVINEKFRVGRPWSSEARIQAYFKTKVKGLYNFRVIYNHMLKNNCVPEEIDPRIYVDSNPKKSL